MYSNYPPGAANDPNAPYNQCDPDPRDFPCRVETFLTRAADVATDHYAYIDDGEECYYETYEESWEERYREDYYTIPQLLEKLQEYVKREIEDIKAKGEKPSYKLQLILDSCDGWEEEEFYVTKE